MNDSVDGSAEVSSVGADSAGTPVRRHSRTPRRPARSRAASGDLLQERIKQIIVEDHLMPGDPMPTELDLIDRLDAGRSSVREALKALQAVGIVEIRHGFGMSVGRMTLTGLIDGLAFQSRISLAGGRRDHAYLLDIREVIEHGMLAKLIALPEPADLTAAAEVIEQMKREAQVGDVRPETDRRFHEMIYTSLNNPLLAPMLGAFWSVLNRASGVYGLSDDRPSDTVRRHEAIYLAVKDRDLPRAQQAMTDHFAGVRQRLRSDT